MSRQKKPLLITGKPDAKFSIKSLDQVPEFKIEEGLHYVDGNAKDTVIVVEGEYAFFNPLVRKKFGTTTLYSCVFLIATSNNPMDGFMAHLDDPTLDLSEHLSKFRDTSSIKISLIGGRPGYNHSQEVLTHIVTSLQLTAKKFKSSITIENQYLLERNQGSLKPGSYNLLTDNYRYIIQKAKLLIRYLLKKPLDLDKIKDILPENFQKSIVTNTNERTIFIAMLFQASAFNHVEENLKLYTSLLEIKDEAHFYQLLRSTFSKEGFEFIDKGRRLQNNYDERDVVDFVFDMETNSIKRIPNHILFPHASHRYAAVIDNGHQDHYRLAFADDQYIPPRFSKYFINSCERLLPFKFGKEQFAKLLSADKHIISVIDTRAAINFLIYLQDDYKSYVTKEKLKNNVLRTMPPSFWEQVPTQRKIEKIIAQESVQPSVIDSICGNTT